MTGEDTAQREGLWQRLIARRWLVVLCAIVTAVGFVNWFAHFGGVLVLGGDAMGTIPTPGHFAVKSHGHETAVNEGQWLFSLFYTTATMLFTGLVVFPCFGFLVFRGIQRQKTGHIRMGITEMTPGVFRVFSIFFVCFYLLWVTGWTYAVTRDFLVSLRAYLSL